MLDSIEMLDAIENARKEVQAEIDYTKDRIKLAKQDSRKLLRSKDGAIEAGIDGYVFDNKIKDLYYVRETLNKRLEVLKKIKYRLDVAMKMLQEI